MKWFIELLKSFFAAFLDKSVEEIKKPDEGHFIGGDKELVDDVNKNIEDEIFGKAETVKMDIEKPSTETINRSLGHG